MKIFRFILLFPFLFGSCREDSMNIDSSTLESNLELKIQAEIDQLNITRADDSGFAEGDVIGVYAVDFVKGQPGTIATTGNNSDNVAFTFSAGSYSWSGTKSVTFVDDQTPIDLYGYYPYSKSVDNVEEYHISVDYNQSADGKRGSMSAYEASDFLWAKSAGVRPSDATTVLYFKHILSSIRVNLIEGEGFDSGEWNGLDKNVFISNTERHASVNLSNGVVKVVDSKDARSIVAKKEKEDFRAIVIPQTIPAGTEILKISVDGKPYSFCKDVDLEFLSSKQHIFTIKVNKKSSNGDYECTLIDEAISPWESDLTSHNGAAKEYIVINSKAGYLAQELKKLNLRADEIVNLKICGSMDEDDFEYVRESMDRLEAINLYEVDLAATNYSIPRYAFSGMYGLRSCVFPSKLKKILNESFNTTGLCGSLIIPEGVTYIGESAFGSTATTNTSTIFSGTLTLPSTLKYIGDGAFSDCSFSGSLLLPEGLETIGNGAFASCTNFTGELHLPSTLKSLGYSAFVEMIGIQGWLEMPSDLERIDGFSLMHFTGIIWPNCDFTIATSAFDNSEIKNDIKLPDNTVALGGASFKDAKIRHIVLPNGITKIPSECFEGSSLQDTIVIPEGVVMIDDWAFASCNNLTAIVLPKTVSTIAYRAFSWCHNINYIRCDAVEPPAVEDYAFYGVQKDNFTLEVPEESVEAYRNAPGWCEFKRISAYRNFVARPSKYNVLNKGGKKEIILNADGDWEMIECPSWCHIDKTSGSKKASLTLTVDAMPKGSATRGGEIVFKLKSNSEYKTTIDVGQCDYEYGEDEYLTLQSASKGKGINLVFLGDGYDAFDIANGTYLADMKQEMEYLFEIEPYNTYREYFNVFTAFALSEDSGVESINQWRKTKFKVCLGDGCSRDGQRISADWKTALDYCATNVPPTISSTNPQVGCVLVGNTEVYEGVCYTGDSFCAVVTKSADSYPYDARGIVQHEAGGHGIGWLADEYIYHHGYIQSCKCRCCQHTAELLNQQSNGFGLNVSLSGKYEDVPWSHLLFHPSYGDIVDVYEGGYFHSRGVYRSEANSCMNNNIPYYSSWSRQLIVKRIMKLAGEDFSLEKFYANDNRTTRSRGSGTFSVGSSTNSNIPVRVGNTPIKITNYKYGKKGGKR